MKGTTISECAKSTYADHDKSVETDLLSEDEIECINKIVKLLQGQLVDNKVIENDEHIYQFWRYLSSKLTDCSNKYNESFVEMERQKTDVEHFTMSCPIDSKEYTDHLNHIGTLIRKRRDLKDVYSYMKVAGENISKIANFIYNMRDRQYSPRSAKYGGSEQGSSQTSIKLGSIPEINKPGI